MDQLPKILQGLPKITDKVALPPDVQKSFDRTTKNLATIKQKLQEQKATIDRSLEIDREYERKMEFYENLHNRAEDVGNHGPAGSQ